MGSFPLGGPCSGVAYWLRPTVRSTSSLGRSVMSEDFQAKTSRVDDDLLLLESVPSNRFLHDLPYVGNSTTDLIVDTFILSFWMAVLPSMILYLDVNLIIWNCNMIVLDIGCDLNCSYITSVEMPQSMYILLTVYEAIIDVMTTGLDDGMKVSHGMLCDGTCDQPSNVNNPGCVCSGAYVMGCTLGVSYLM
nr:hypothetical protein [Tanacetum cinerariifolium]